MLNKKTTTKGDKRKKGEEDKTANSDWAYSKCSINDLLRLVSESLLQEKDVVQWCPSFHQPYLQEDVDEIVLFQHFVKRGLALPTSDFFCGYFYGLQLHHLNPKSIAHVAIFVHLCETFLGIES
jgi:hypothetical protein